MPERKKSRRKVNSSQGFGPIFIAKAGAKGACSVCLIFFGIVLMGIGGTLYAAGSTKNDEEKAGKPKSLDDPFFDDMFARGDSAFESIHRPLQVTGPILIGVGGFLVIVAAILCVYIAKKRPRPPRPSIVTTPQQPLSVVQGQQASGSSSKPRPAKTLNVRFGPPPEYTSKSASGTNLLPDNQQQDRLSSPPKYDNSVPDKQSASQQSPHPGYQPVPVQASTRAPQRARPVTAYSLLTSVPEEAD